VKKYSIEQNAKQSIITCQYIILSLNPDDSKKCINPQFRPQVLFLNTILILKNYLKINLTKNGRINAPKRKRIYIENNFIIT
jgi:hypothetical protein